MDSGQSKTIKGTASETPVISETRVSKSVKTRAKHAGQKAVPAIKSAAAKTPTNVKKATSISVKKSREIMQQGVSVLTFRDFRDSVESALTDLVGVVAAQSAEIQRLKARVADLERQRQSRA